MRTTSKYRRYSGWYLRRVFRPLSFKKEPTRHPLSVLTPRVCRRTHEVILALGVWSTSRPRLFCIWTSPPRKSRYPCLLFCHANECNNRVSSAASIPGWKGGRKRREKLNGLHLGDAIRGDAEIRGKNKTRTMK